LAVLTDSEGNAMEKAIVKKKLRGGYSTGACAAAAAKAALLALVSGGRAAGDSYIVKINLPDMSCVEFAATCLFCKDGVAACSVTKDGGDDPDATHGIEIVAQVEMVPGAKQEIEIAGGQGVGHVTRPGLQIPIGEPAINPVPRQMIREALVGLLTAENGCRVTISVPRGEEVALRTMNPRLGIVGGISILGTRGRVRPMSVRSLTDSLLVQLDVARGEGYDTVVCVPGGIGEKAMLALGFAKNRIVEMSNFIGIMLDGASERGLTRVLLAGHHSKLVKVAGGIFQTHSRIADGRREIYAAHAALAGGSQQLVARLMEASTAEECYTILQENGLSQEVLASIADAAARYACQRGEGLVVETLLLDYAGSVLGVSKGIIDAGGITAWREKYM
jgi:cobalt-precorrin-5B (C1)-methyltransferase